MAVDKVTLQILANHCRAAAESMAYTLYRTAHSTFVKETEDFTTGLTTPRGPDLRGPQGPRCHLVRLPRLQERHRDDPRLRGGRHLHDERPL